MQDNVYAASAAVLADAPVVATRTTTPFFVVAPWKFVLLYLATLGLYRYYWSYMHWARFRRATQTPMWPVARAIFAIFFMHELNTESDHRARKLGPVRWSPGNSTTLYVVSTIVAFVISRLVANDVGPEWLSLVSVGMLAPLAYSLWRTQCVANMACGDPAGQANARLTWANWIWLSLGAVLWLLIALGTLMMVLGIDADA